MKSLQLFRQDRCGSSLPINRYFFCFFAASLSPPNKQAGHFGGLITSLGLAWPGLTAPPVPAHPFGRSVEHPG